MLDKHNETSITRLLAKRYPSPEWAFLPQVRNGTSYRRKTVRTADALAQNLWGSRGLELHGFEIKVSRQDWKKELAQPDKSDDIQQFCDRWWIVVDGSNIVQPGELPPTWGLIVCSGDKLKAQVEAPKLESKPIDRLMFCAIVRRLTENSVPRESISDQVEAARKQAATFAKESAEREIKELKKAVEAFELASGMSIHYSWEAEKIGQAVKLVCSANVDSIVYQVQSLHREATAIAARTAEALKMFQAEPAGKV